MTPSSTGSSVSPEVSKYCKVVLPSSAVHQQCKMNTRVKNNHTTRKFFIFSLFCGNMLQIYYRYLNARRVNKNFFGDTGN